MSRITPYSRGRVWLCDSRGPYSDESFLFIVKGSGRVADEKRCLIYNLPYGPNTSAWWNHWEGLKNHNSVRASRKRIPWHSNYKHSHLKKHGRLLEASVVKEVMALDSGLQKAMAELRRNDHAIQGPMEQLAWAYWDRIWITLNGDRFIELHGKAIQKEILARQQKHFS